MEFKNNRERDKYIREECRNGRSRQDVANELGMSRTRISEIAVSVQKECTKERDRQIVEAYLDCGESMKDIAEFFNITASRVSEVVRKAREAILLARLTEEEREKKDAESKLLLEVTRLKMKRKTAKYIAKYLDVELSEVKSAFAKIQEIG